MKGKKEKEKIKTVGDRINKTVATYFKVYLDFKGDENKELSDKAESLAIHDLIINKYVAEKSLENLRFLIAEHRIRQVELAQAKKEKAGGGVPVKKGGKK